MAISLYMTLIGYGVLVAIPVISNARVQWLGYSEAQVGRIASADLGGLAAGAVLASWLLAHVSRRTLVVMGTVVVIAANALCLLFTDYLLVFCLRLLAGIGSGVYTAIAVANLGATSNPARAYNFMLFAFAFSQALELHFLPQLTMNGIYVAFMIAFASGLFALRWIPDSVDEQPSAIAVDIEDELRLYRAESRQVPAYIVWLCLLAILLTYINIGGYWTYIELAARAAAVDGKLISRLLVWGSLASVIGCLLATAISDRWGLIRPLLLALFTMSLTVGILGEGIDAPKLMLSMLSFNLLWIFVDVYQMGFIANADHSGRFSALIPSAQGLGQIIGPNIAASMLEMSLSYDWIFLMSAGFALLGMLTYCAVYWKLHTILPALANAS